MVDLRIDFWVRETGTGQQVAQLCDRYMMMAQIVAASNFYLSHIPKYAGLLRHSSENHKPKKFLSQLSTYDVNCSRSFVTQ